EPWLARGAEGRQGARAGPVHARRGAHLRAGGRGAQPPVHPDRRSAQLKAGPPQVPRRPVCPIIADTYPPGSRRSRTKCVRGASRDLAVIMAAGPMNRTSSHISDAAAVRWIIADTYPPGLGG